MTNGKTYNIQIEVAEDGIDTVIRPVGKAAPLIVIDDGFESDKLGAAVRTMMNLLDKKEKREAAIKLVKLNPKDKQ